jgi:hypothetical protein
MTRKKVENGCRSFLEGAPASTIKGEVQPMAGLGVGQERNLNITVKMRKNKMFERVVCTETMLSDFRLRFRCQDSAESVHKTDLTEPFSPVSRKHLHTAFSGFVTNILGGHDLFLQLRHPFHSTVHLLTLPAGRH